MKFVWPSLWNTLFCDKVRAFNPVSLHAGCTAPLLTRTVRGRTRNFSALFVDSVSKHRLKADEKTSKLFALLVLACVFAYRCTDRCLRRTGPGVRGGGRYRSSWLT